MARSMLFYNTLMTLWPLSRLVYWIGNRPALRPLSRSFFKALRAEAIIIPVQETISRPENIVLPYPLLTPLIECASRRVLMNECMCRRGDNCQTYPQDLGCLFLGEGAGKISPSMGQTVGQDEAMAHVRRAMALGLVPLVVHTTFDAMTLGIPYREMLGICFCCDCCCTVRQGLRLGPPSFWDIVVPLPGLALRVGESCQACGACVEVCYVAAISLRNGRAMIHEGLCKGCGRCLSACPTDALSLELDEQADILPQLVDRISRRTDIGLARIVSTLEAE